MKELILKAIEQFSLIRKGDRVTVALSGGADSMSLLYALNSLKKELGITLFAAHLNHMIRGDEALRDEQFVKAECDKLGVKLFCEQANIPEIAQKNGESLELCARKVRYSFLERVSNGGLVATAHTASDNLETMLFNLARGTAIDGLCGIPPKRDIYVRPLIFVTRDDVEKYCKQESIPFVTDSTNLSDDYTRNKIRHKIIPVLKEINQNAETSAVNTALNLREDASFIKLLAKEYIADNLSEKKLCLSGFKKLNVSVKKRVIIDYITSAVEGVSLERVHITEILKICENGGKTNLPKDNYALVYDNKLSVITKDNVNIPQFNTEIEEISAEFLKNTENVNNLFLNSLVDCDKICGNAVFRTRLQGDSIRPIGKGCTKTLNKWFTELKVDKEFRDYIPVFADEKGPVWVYGIGVASRCALSDKSKRIVKINVVLRGEKNVKQ